MLLFSLAVPVERAGAQSGGLVAAYSFEEGTGSAVGDASGNDRTGIISGATWTPVGRFGGALSFDGTNDLVSVTDTAALDLSTGMTLEAWVNPIALSNWRTVVLKEKPSGLAYALYAHDTARPGAWINTGGADIGTSATSALPLNTWTHLAATYDGAIVRIYVNGAQVGSRAMGGAIVASALPLRIGGNAVWGEYFAGLIDEVRIYNRALTASEIQADMNTPIGPAPPPPPPPGASIGQWSAPVELGLVAVNMVHLHTGKILMYGGETHGGTSATLWDPVTFTSKAVPAPYNVFCSGHSALADGRILVVGGHDNAGGILGSNRAAIFDPVSESWASVPGMAQRRWYPTATTLPDGRVLVTSGATTCFDCIADIPEIYDPRANSWTPLTSARLAFPYYPFIFVLPDGRILNAGAGEHPALARTLDLATQSWTTVDPLTVDGGSAVMYRPGKVLKSGTSATTDVSNVPTEPTTYVLDMTQPTPAWRQTPSMAFPRAYHTLTVLPDGNVLVTGGGVTTEGKDTSAAVHEAELWSPTTETWQTMAAMQVPRLYHGTALLLPDGRVLVAGSGDSFGGPNQTTAEFYSPPYLFKGAPPAIASAPSQIPYGAPFTVNISDTAAIASVALVRPGAVTHQFDEDQRFASLTFQQDGSTLSVDAPATEALAPPGYYMLFVLNQAGVPSVARLVRFPSPAEDTTPPGPPGTLTAANGVLRVVLSWGASGATDVVRYNVHRSTVAGFTPATANRIAQPAGTTYTDAGLVPGTYYYRIIAEDAAGNVSAPSNEAAGTALADIQAPNVAITALAAGATVSGIVTITATASDDQAVAGVRFQVDGANVGAEDTTSPYSFSWDSRTVPNGTHVLTAVARDTGNNLATSSSVTVTVSNTTQPPAAGLVGAYAFNEGSGTTTSDRSGNGNTGTLSGATWSTAGRTGAALSFDGVNDRVNVNDSASVDLAGGMTLQAWVYPTALSSWRTVLLKERSGGLVYALYANDDVSTPAAYVRVGSVDVRVAGISPLPLNTWTHLAATYDGAILRLYVNGQQVGSQARTGAIQVSTGLLRLGGNAVWGEWFAGRIDDVRIYNRPLTANEIQIDMATPVP
jgi:concanavalin A-like lectin/glucanase superfamily protein/galactose oxidase-like protein/Big-like domain-containing protein